MSEELVDRFRWLFRGRVDVRGTWGGGAIREPLTREHYERHLTSTDPSDWIGVYPLGKEACTWGCIDIDGGDFPKRHALEDPGYDRKSPEFHDWDAMSTLAVNLTVVLEVKNVFAHIERTRNGYHVWVFPEAKLVPAKVMRRALMAACKAVDYRPNEVNPKSESLQDGKVGNYIRLPYYGALHPDRPDDYVGADRYFFQDNNPNHCKVTLHEFLDSVKPTTTAALEAIAALWTPPQAQWSVDTGAGLDAEPLVRRVNALGYTIWRDGPLPGSDRSSTLAHLAHLCRESNLTVDEAFTVVRSADERHGRKFADREDGEQRIAEMIESAYAV
jgi:hypothetical protein